MQVTGKLKLKGEVQTFDSGFKKREFVLTTQEQYPQDIKFELFKDKVSDIDSVSVSQSITVHFDIRGNEFNGKYYNNLVAWKLEKQDIKADSEAPIEAVSEEEDENSLPF